MDVLKMMEKKSFINIETFVISLPEASKRQKRVEEEFSKIGMRFQFFDGVDAMKHQSELLEITDVNAWERNMGAKLTLGHLGCYMAHVKLWEKIGNMKTPALICEDDVSFTKDFPRALQVAIEMQADWDICRFAKIRSVGAIKVKAIEQFRLNYYWGPFTGNACYLIQPNAASRLANSFIPITRAHDHELNRFFSHDIRLTGLEPFTAKPRDGGESYITGSSMDNVYKFNKIKRLPHYSIKAMNYLFRLVWLIKRGILFKRYG
jgi:glycosyl transferase family 25